MKLQQKLTEICKDIHALADEAESVIPRRSADDILNALEGRLRLLITINAVTEMDRIVTAMEDDYGDNVP